MRCYGTPILGVWQTASLEVSLDEFSTDIGTPRQEQTRAPTLPAFPRHEGDAWYNHKHSKSMVDYVLTWGQQSVTVSA